MANEILNSLLKEYEQKKMREEIAADNRKEELYTKIPRLKKLDNEINSYAISVTKNILNSKSYSLSSLSDKINSLKREKEVILEENHIEFKQVATSEISISLIVDLDDGKKACQAICAAFDL